MNIRSAVQCCGLIFAGRLPVALTSMLLAVCVCPLVYAQDALCPFDAHTNTTTCIIDKPNVASWYPTTYDKVLIKAGDKVTIDASGCVQTGGSGKTWKRYVDPTGRNSDRLYHGLIDLPGITNGMKRIMDVQRTKDLVVPNGITDQKVRLWYEDDNYNDNGYYSHDDGTDDQCKGIGPAKVVLTIHHASTCPPAGPEKATVGLFNIPRTGQTTAYAAGDDGALQKGSAWSVSRFRRDTKPNGITTIIDDRTHLRWTQSPGAGCAPSDPKMTWEQALDYVKCLNGNAYSGFYDWRLPNINELATIVDTSQSNNAAWLNAHGFNYVGGGYWSSTSTAPCVEPKTTCGSWVIDMVSGKTLQISKTDRQQVHRAWAVRTEPNNVSYSPATGQTAVYSPGDDGDSQQGIRAASRFSIIDNYTMKDNLTGLVWSRNADAPGPYPKCTGALPSSSRPMTWNAALDYVNCLNTHQYQGHKTWRLPNRNELLSLVNYGQPNTGAWLTGKNFYNVQKGFYWTSTTYSPYSAPPTAWVVNMIDGSATTGSKNQSYFVWILRDEP